MSSHDLCSPVEGIFNLGRLGTDLDCVGAMRRVFKQSIVWVEQLPRYFEEKLTLRTTIVKPRVRYKEKHQELPKTIKHHGLKWVTVRYWTMVLIVTHPSSLSHRRLHFFFRRCLAEVPMMNL